MPILILGVLVIAGLLGYMFITNHKDKFVRDKEDVHGPFDVIYLPADLEEEKKKDDARRAAAANAANSDAPDVADSADGAEPDPSDEKTGNE